MPDCIKVSTLDHLVLSVVDIQTTLAFYTDVLGMHPEVFYPADGSVRHALKFGDQKINLHPLATPYKPRAAHTCAGSADLCFLSEIAISDWQDHLTAKKINTEIGPVPRTGATGPILSIYIRDPDGNLIEISNSLTETQ